MPAIFAVFQFAFHLSTEVKYIQLYKVYGMYLCTGVQYFFLYFSAGTAFCHVELSTLSSICSELHKSYSLPFHVIQKVMPELFKRDLKVYTDKAKTHF